MNWRVRKNIQVYSGMKNYPRMLQFVENLQYFLKIEEVGLQTKSAI